MSARDAHLGAAEASAEGASGRFGDPGWSEATWAGAEPAPTPDKTLLQRLRGAARLLGFAIATLILLPPFFIARALGGRRDRAVAALWCGLGVWVCGLRLRRVGRPIEGGGALLANHCSWIDILAVGAAAPVHFVAKAEVAGWPLFGWIGKISNTVFIARRRAEAKAQERMLAIRASEGDLLCLFPEGTSTDGLRVAPFKSSLFAMFFPADGERPALEAQPVTIHYRPAAHLPDTFYGWWGRMGLIGHLWDVVCLGQGGVATVAFHPIATADAFENRKDFAAAAESRVRAGLTRIADGRPALED